MKQKLISILLLSITLISCNTQKNVQVLDDLNTSTDATLTSSLKGSIHDEDISPNKSTSENLSKLELESIVKNQQNLVFKTVQLKKGKSINSKDENKYNVSGLVNYYDDKGNLKTGSNLSISLKLNDKVIANSVTDENGFWSTQLDKQQVSGKNLKTSLQFTNKYWVITGKGKTYSWDGPEINNINSDIDLGTISPVKGSENAKAAFINDIFNRYLSMFKKEGVDINPWWKKQLKTVWPGDSNYYSWGTVNLTDADHWDVNGHEIGHAMTDLGTNSEMGGGQHKIDECYSEALAWSEGFATFLSGVISLDKADTDARFEFLVPRRAPIRIENVPDDVCKGQKNEWRVSAAMWDLYDAHEDGSDVAIIPFKTIWSALGRKDKRIGSMKDAADSLKEIAPKELTETIDKSMQQNTMF